MGSAHRISVKVPVKQQYFCPECGGKTRQFRAEDDSTGRPATSMNTVRVDHRNDCARWNFIVRTWPRLVGMRKIATPVI